MYRETIDNLIKSATLDRKVTDLKVLRLIKAEFQKFSTSKNNKNVLNTLDDVQELKILKKLHKQWKEEYEAFVCAKREKEALELEKELKLLEALIPAEPSLEETKVLIKDVIENYLKGLPIEERASMKHLGAIIKIIKTNNPTADSKLISEIYKSMIGI